MSLYVQFPTDSRDPDESVLQRRRFHDHVRGRTRTSRDRVIVVEPNPHLIPALRALWSDVKQVELIEAAVVEPGPSSEVDVRTVTFFRALEDGPLFASAHVDESAVRRRFPSGTLEQLRVPALSAATILQAGMRATEHDAADGLARVALLALDVDDPATVHLVDAMPLGEVDEITLAIHGDPGGERLRRLTRTLRARGFVAAGRPWGEAGEGILFRRPRSAGDRLESGLAETRMRAGRLVVTARDDWAGPARRATVMTRLRVAALPHLRPADVLDPALGAAWRPPLTRAVESRLPPPDAQTTGEWTVAAPLVDDPWTVAQECHERHGVWPISFSYPRPPLAVQEHPTRLVSPITPGFRYSFDDEGAYLRCYADAYWGVTHRKAGWDCFRHVEIMASGAVPLMLDAAQIPRYSMAHYPKAAMAAAAALLTPTTPPTLPRPDEATRAAFRDHFERHLTSRAMAEYLLRAAGLSDATRVLFVDARLPGHADYQSVLTLIGLKELLGPDCHVLHPVDYVYDDAAVDTRSLYGRGFGYTRVLPGSWRSRTELEGALSLPDMDAVVVGSVTRNHDEAVRLLSRYPAAQTVWIHGEDAAPTPDEVADYRQAGVAVFVRAIHVNH